MIKKLNVPLVFLALPLIVLYFCIFTPNLTLWFCFFAFLFLLFYRKYWKIFPILFVFGLYFSIVHVQSEKLEHTPIATLTSVIPISDTIQVNGDLLSFQALSHHRKFQVYYQIKSKQEQQFYKTLTKNVILDVDATLESPETKRNFNGFDDRAFLLSQNIGQIVTLQKIKKITNLRPQLFDLRLLRRRAIVFIQKHFKAPESNYMTGLLFGFLGKDFGEMTDLYTRLGIIHLFALSGMQVNFFIAGFRKFLLRLGMTKEKVGILQLPFSLSYAFLTGLSVSVIRALLQKNIRLKGMDNVSATLILILILMPKSMLSIGGQLTLFYAFVIQMIAPKVERLGKIKQSLVYALALSFLVLPVLIFDFHVFQPFSILLTFAFSFLFDVLLLPLLLLSFLFSFLGIILPIHALFNGLEAVIHGIDQIIHYPLVFGSIGSWTFLLLLILAGLLIDFWKNKNFRLCLFILISLCYLSCKIPLHPSITMMDVGQGDSIFLQDQWNRQNILIDTGGKVSFKQKSEWQKSICSSNAENTLIPALQAKGVSQIDHLILTHTDDDHVGDFVTLADKIKIKEVCVTPGELTCPDFIKKLKQAKVSIHVLKVGDKIPIFDSSLDVLSNGYTHHGDNNDSVITYGNFYGTHFLFTGDLEKKGELELLKQYPTLKVDVLKAGHHGSKTSSAPEFINAIQPKIALISVGKNNRYGHPNQETLVTFKKYHVAVFRTDQHGAIALTNRLKKWQMTTVK